MKLLLDQNLSRRLLPHIDAAFPGSTHVALIGLDTASDREIWDYAAEHGFTVMSKDSDFRQLAFLYGPPPKVIWLRIGNAATSAAIDTIDAHIDAIREFEDRVDEAMLVLSHTTR